MGLTKERLMDSLFYCEKSGEFTRIKSVSRFSAGSIAGSARTDGYIAICVDGVDYLAHRLAWFYIYGIWPSGVIDHINHDKKDNSIGNLRDVVVRVNMENRVSPSKRNVSGLLGVVFDKRCGRYRAQIMSRRKNFYLGSFDTAELAHAAYIKAKKEIHCE